MKKAVIASLLAVSAFAIPGTFSQYAVARAQAPAAQGSGVQMDPPEYADYTAAMGQTTPQTQAPALEAYLAKYPKSQVKDAVLAQIMVAYSQFDHARAVTAAGNVLQSNPNNLQAYIIEVVFGTEAAQAQTDPAAKQAGLDSAAAAATRGLAAGRPAGLNDADYAKLKAYAVPTFYGAIGADDLGKKDGPGAVKAFKAQLAAMDPATLATPPALQVSFFIGQAYYVSTPPDYVNCTFYTTRAASLAPDQYKPQLQPLANYCYKKFHGTMDGYDAVVAAAKANLDPPSGFSITPAPTDQDIANNLMSTTKDEDIAKLATGDKEFVLAHGSDANKAKVWDVIKGKSYQFPDVLVIESSPTVVKVAISDDAVQSKTADFTFNMTPLTAPEEPRAKTAAALAAFRKEKAAYDKEVAADAAATAVGKTVTLSGTFDSYTPSPIVIIMTDGAVILPKATPPPPARRPVRK